VEEGAGNIAKVVLQEPFENDFFEVKQWSVVLLRAHA
jgi:hypothetical protein